MQRVEKFKVSVWIQRTRQGTRVPLLIALAVCVLTAVQSCRDINVYPVSQDVSMGASIDKELRTNSKEYKIYQDEVVRGYVQDIVKKIVALPGIKYREQFPYTVTIIDDSKTLNAFCTPGGYIYVYTGLIKALDNEASLAAVLGHEIAHAECRHSTERMTKSLGAQIVLDLALGNDASAATQTAANLFTGLALLRNSRDNEDEADEQSFKYLMNSVWYPGAISYFFEKVNNRSRGGALERWTSTHPLPQDRIDATARRIKEAKLSSPTEAQLFSDRYLQMRNRIR
jgi:predicted Zn-dependent protease